MRHCATHLLGVIAIVVLTPLAAVAASFSPLGQTRFVLSRAEIGATVEEHSESATDFSPFSESVSAQLDDGSSFAQGDASQSSALTENDFEATGSVYTSGFYAGLGLARSDAEFVFEVTELSTYSLSGEVFGESDAFTFVRLVDSSDEILEYHSSYDFGNGGPGGAYSGGGILVPGEYTFRALTRSCSDELGICGMDTGSGSFTASLVMIAEPVPPVPALGPTGLLLVTAGLLGFSAHRRGHA